MQKDLRDYTGMKKRFVTTLSVQKDLRDYTETTFFTIALLLSQVKKGYRPTLGVKKGYRPTLGVKKGYRPTRSGNSTQAPQGVFAFRYI